MANPLRKLDEKIGAPYVRPAEVEAQLEQLLTLSREDLIARSAISDRGHPDHIRSECLLHLVRQTRSDNRDELFRELFKSLRRRVGWALPAPDRIGPGGRPTSVRASDLEIREAVLFRFNELLCADRQAYDERLDFFEVRFDMAIAALRSTAQRKARKQEARTEPLEQPEGGEDTSKKVEEALTRLREPPIDEKEAGDCRLRLLTAIGELPTDQKRVIEMLLLEVPIDAANPSAFTIARALGCDERTVRNRRNRAYASLKKRLEGCAP